MLDWRVELADRFTHLNRRSGLYIVVIVEVVLKLNIAALSTLQYMLVWRVSPVILHRHLVEYTFLFTSVLEGL